MNIDLTGINILFYLVSLIFAIGIHEAMHGYAAFWLGDDTAQQEGRLTLNPLKHIDPVLTVLMPMMLLLLGLPPFLAAKPVPFNPMRVKYEEFGAALIALAGPLTNFALAAFTAVLLRLFVGIDSLYLLQALSIFLVVNVAIFVFNMIPFPPLDGSRVLYAVAPAPVQRVMEQIEQMGLVIILISFALLYSVIGPFLQDMNQAVLQFLL
ncbi:site-2 protease family protein [Candidatus Saccharibacteria bacterium]|nr:site-2 protease family protein [Candidatus Saccharibacteria bacterium]